MSGPWAAVPAPPPVRPASPWAVVVLVGVPVACAVPRVGASPGGLLVVAVVAAVAAFAWTRTLPALRHVAAATTARAARPAVGPLALATVFAVLGVLPVLTVSLVAVALVLVLLARARPGTLSRVADLGERVGDVLGRVLGVVAMVPAAAVVLVLSVAYRVLGVDPLRGGPRTAGPAWVPAPPPGRVEQGWVGGVEVRLPKGVRFRRGAALAGTVVLIAVATLAFLLRPAPAPTSAALADADWPSIWAEQEAFNANPSFDPTTVFRLDDFRGRHVNQVDGVRVTWRPPPCDCRRVRVWWFGGSAGWGFYQSDEQTIPSQLARAAWERGVALDITNYALPGYSASQEAQLFAQLLMTEDPPDLAVFYDGANELYLQVNRNNAGRGSDESPAVYGESTFDGLLRAMSWPQRVWSRLQPGEAVGGAPAEPALDAPEVAAHATARYRRQVELIRRVAEPSGVPVLFLWQPTLSTSPDAVAAEFEPLAPNDRLWHRRLAAAGRAGLPTGVVDLSEVFDGRTDPIFPDWAHTNAAGSGVVAGAVLPEVLGRVPAPAP